jgi:glucose/arabinose dehydrogenase
VPSPPHRPRPSASADLAALEISFEPVADGFSQPLLVLGAGDGSGRLFVAEKGGALKVIRNGEVDPELFLDLTSDVSTESERGLLGVAFPEDFAEHGRFYVSYTDGSGSSVISRFLAEDGRADRGSESILLRTPQPYANHNGGHIAFGPDGFLYVGLGDGGSGGDPMGNGQNLFTLLGTILRLDVGEAPEVSTESDGNGYTIPADNPFADGEEGLPEIWSYGLRNPVALLVRPRDRRSVDRRCRPERRGRDQLPAGRERRWRELGMEPVRRYLTVSRKTARSQRVRTTSPGPSSSIAIPSGAR